MEECLTLGLYKLPQKTIIGYGIVPGPDNDNQELIDAVNDCLDYVFNLHQKWSHCEDAYELVETKVGLSGYAEDYGCGDLADVYGTLDYCYIIPSKGLMYIIDWKFGKGIEVFPTSEQLKAYALGKLKNKVNASKFKKIGIIIGQPRLYSGEHFKKEVTTPTDLCTWLGDDLVPALLNARSKNPKFCASAESCRWCEVKNTCDFRTSYNLEIAQEVFAIHATLPKPDMTKVSELLLKLPNLKQFMSDMELYATNQLKNGIEVPFYKMVAGRSLRKWKDQAIFLDWGETQGLDEFSLSEMKVLSPAKAEKKVGRALSKTKEFQELIIKPEGKPTMVHESDKREALIFETASEKFAKHAVA